jgi:hydroxyacylglutathione hydrolase
MLIEEFVVTPFEQNARIVACDKTKRAICIDPGDEAERLARAIDHNDLQLQAIALTHAHMDHIGAVAALKKLKPDAEIILHAADEKMYHALPEQPAWMGIPRATWAMLGIEYDAPPPINRFWSEGEIYAVGNLRFEVLHCPGHAPGHVVLFERDERKLFAGDCLFAGSIGRTDLPGGSSEQLLASINDKIISLGDDVTVYTGHGPNTTVGRERRTNPFLTGALAF